MQRSDIRMALLENHKLVRNHLLRKRRFFSGDYKLSKSDFMK